MSTFQRHIIGLAHRVLQKKVTLTDGEIKSLLSSANLTKVRPTTAAHKIIRDYVQREGFFADCPEAA